MVSNMSNETAQILGESFEIVDPVSDCSESIYRASSVSYDDDSTLVALSSDATLDNDLYIDQELPLSDVIRDGASESNNFPEAYSDNDSIGDMFEWDQILENVKSSLEASEGRLKILLVGCRHCRNSETKALFLERLNAKFNSSVTEAGTTLSCSSDTATCQSQSSPSQSTSVSHVEAVLIKGGAPIERLDWAESRTDQLVLKLSTGRSELIIDNRDGRKPHANLAQLAFLWLCSEDAHYRDMSSIQASCSVLAYHDIECLPVFAYADSSIQTEEYLAFLDQVMAVRDHVAATRRVPVQESKTVEVVQDIAEITTNNYVGNIARPRQHPAVSWVMYILPMTLICVSLVASGYTLMYSKVTILPRVSNIVALRGPGGINFSTTPLPTTSVEAQTALVPSVPSHELHRLSTQCEPRHMNSIMQPLQTQQQVFMINQTDREVLLIPLMHSAALCVHPGELDVQVSRGDRSLAPHINITALRTVVVRLPEKEAHGNVTIALKSLAFNEQHTVDFGEPGDMLGRTAMLLDSLASSFVTAASDTLNQAQQAQKYTTYMIKNAVEETISKASLVTSRASLETTKVRLEKVRARVSTYNALKQLPIQVPEPQDLQMSLLRAQLGARLLWLKMRRDHKQYAEYAKRAEVYIAEQGRKLRERRAAQPGPKS